jgi:hypothetical protein
MPETIRFNVGQRGRTHRGKDRNFDTRALAALVNSPETQERVKNRDMLGYYGHWLRMKFGLIPPETAIVGGKVVKIEPAIVTTYLHAEPDGTIEHQTEFLDTAAGKVAARLHRSKAGGFSSAIHAAPRGGLDVPTVFAGFDYVLEPNFTTNRGYTFDSVAGESGEDGAIFDFVMHDFTQGNEAMLTLYDSLQADHALALATMQKLMEENEELMSALARGGNTVLDGVGGQRPALLSKQATQAFAATASGFRGASLARFGALPDEGSSDTMLDRAMQQWGIPR